MTSQHIKADIALATAFINASKKQAEEDKRIIERIMRKISDIADEAGTQEPDYYYMEDIALEIETILKKRLF